MITFVLKKYWDNNRLDWSQSPVTRVIDSIEFIIFLIIFYNYMIIIYGYKIEHQPKNKNLFDIVIILCKAKNK
jgi:hypothetical protein